MKGSRQCFEKQEWRELWEGSAVVGGGMRRVDVDVDVEMVGVCAQCVSDCSCRCEHRDPPSPSHHRVRVIIDF